MTIWAENNHICSRIAASLASWNDVMSITWSFIPTAYLTRDIVINAISVLGYTAIGAESISMTRTNKRFSTFCAFYHGIACYFFAVFYVYVASMLFVLFGSLTYLTRFTQSLFRGFKHVILSAYRALVFATQMTAIFTLTFSSIDYLVRTRAIENGRIGQWFTFVSWLELRKNLSICIIAVSIAPARCVVSMHWNRELISAIKTSFFYLLSFIASAISRAKFACWFICQKLLATRLANQWIFSWPFILCIHNANCTTELCLCQGGRLYRGINYALELS